MGSPGLNVRLRMEVVKKMGNAPEWYVVVLLGLGTVFVGLIVLIFIIKLMSAVLGSFNKEKAPAPVAAPAAAQPIANRGEFVAAVSAAIASAMGTDVSGLRILSIKKV